MGLFLLHLLPVTFLDELRTAEQALSQTDIFEAESCGQCAPCRIGTRVLGRALQRYLRSGDPKGLGMVEDVAWEMDEGSICGLGIAAPLPLTSAMRHFPAAFEERSKP